MRSLPSQPSLTGSSRPRYGARYHRPPIPPKRAQPLLTHPCRAEPSRAALPDDRRLPCAPSQPPPGGGGRAEPRGPPAEPATGGGGGERRRSGAAGRAVRGAERSGAARPPPPHRRSYSDPPIKVGQSAGGSHVTGQFQLPRRIFLN